MRFLFLSLPAVAALISMTGCETLFPHKPTHLPLESPDAEPVRTRLDSLPRISSLEKATEISPKISYVKALQQNIKEGLLVEGRQGVVLSPYAPDKGEISVDGLVPGTKVKDPYTGRIMIVPLPDGMPAGDLSKIRVPKGDLFQKPKETGADVKKDDVPQPLAAPPDFKNETKADSKTEKPEDKDKKQMLAPAVTKKDIPAEKK